MDLLSLQEEYPSVDISKALGCLIDNSGSLMADFHDLEEKLWKAFYKMERGKLAAGEAKKLGIWSKLWAKR